MPIKKQLIVQLIDTSVIGGCFDNEFKEWSNKLILDVKHCTYLPVLSEVTVAEIEDAPQNVLEKYQEIFTRFDCSTPINEFTLKTLFFRKFGLNHAICSGSTNLTTLYIVQPLPI